MGSETPTHIVKSFDEELQKLDETILRMGGLAESLLGDALNALKRRDSDLASRVVQSDAEIDRAEIAVSETAVRILALRQPMANDLRVVISALMAPTSPSARWRSISCLRPSPRTPYRVWEN